MTSQLPYILLLGWFTAAAIAAPFFVWWRYRSIAQRFTYPKHVAILIVAGMECLALSAICQAHNFLLGFGPVTWLAGVGVVVAFAGLAVFACLAALTRGEPPRRTSQDLPIGPEVDHYER